MARRSAVVLLTLALVAAVGCRGKGSGQPSQPDRPTTAPTTAATSYSSSKFGIEFAFPAGWTPAHDPDLELVLVGPAGAGRETISLDIPDLPPHLPGMIPLRLVKNGYLDDLRKKVGQLRVEQDTAQDFPRASARLVRSAWTSDGRAFSETALLMVHGDRVFIIRATADEASYPATRAAFDSVVQSIKWVH